MAGRPRSKTPPPASDPTSIGNLLLRRGLLTVEQLDRALAHQMAGEVLGHTVSRLGLLDRHVVEAIVEQQEVLRRPEAERAEAVCAAADVATEKTLEVAKLLGGS